MEDWALAPGQKLWFILCRLWRTNSVLLLNEIIELFPFLCSLATWYLPKRIQQHATFFKCWGVCSLSCQIIFTSKFRLKNCQRGSHFTKKGMKVYINWEKLYRKQVSLRWHQYSSKTAQGSWELAGIPPTYHMVPHRPSQGHKGVLHVTLINCSRWEQSEQMELGP